MKLVISIVSWNTKEYLRTCLASLIRRCDLERTRIVVIDNASSDGTQEMVRKEFQQVTLIETGSNLGFGRAHNLVAAHSDEPFVLFLNPDTEFISDAQERMLRVFDERPDVGALGCRMCNLDRSVQPLGFQWRTTPLTVFVEELLVSQRSLPLMHRIIPSHDPLEDGEVHKLYGGCLMVRRKTLDQVGWFDERFFMYSEDVDLSRRIVEGGWRLYHLGSASVIHLCGGASAKAPGRFATLMQCHSRAALMEKYYGRWGRVLYRNTILLRSFSRLCVSLPIYALNRIIEKSDPVSTIDSRRKLFAMLKWSIGREQPVIPT
jgi:GT2 family glycosyltransferase